MTYMNPQNFTQTAKRFRAAVVVLAVFAALAIPVLGVLGGSGTASAQTTTQARAGCNANTTFFGLVPWYKYLELEQVHAIEGDASSPLVCKVTSFDNESKVLSKTSPILLIALAILEDLIRVAALAAVGFIIYGGIQYMTSQGSPDDTKRAQQTIINALIGLVIALVAIGLVSFLGTQLGG